jgi:small redox-active disulfide protein 2
MKKIQVLGPGCAKCKQLNQTVESAVRALGLNHQVEKVTDIEQIMAFGVVMTPALVVDGQVKVAGRVPSLEEMKKLLA